MMRAMHINRGSRNGVREWFSFWGGSPAPAGKLPVLRDDILIKEKLITGRVPVSPITNADCSSEGDPGIKPGMVVLLGDP